jgi:monovalent cation:H+ antiporter-2, CPA2 family
MIIAASLLAAFGTKAIFGLSLALGALFAGIIIGQTESHHWVGEEVRPFRDVFGVLFFAAVGMLFDPRTLLWLPGQVLAVLGIIMIGKMIISGLVVVALRQPLVTALVVAPALAQIGEFSFILATVGRELHLLPNDGYQLIVTGALVSIALNPVMFRLADALAVHLRTPIAEVA